MVAGHPAILTLLIDDSGDVASLQIETDPKARLYVRKKAFFLGLQARSRYGSDGWACTEGQPGREKSQRWHLPQGTLYQDDQRPFARCRTQSVPPGWSRH